MAEALQPLILEFDVNDKGKIKVREIERAVGQMTGTLDQAKRQMGLLGQASSMLSGGLGILGRGFSALQRLVFSFRGLLAGVGITLTARSFIQAAKTVEMYRMQFELLTGSMQEGKKIFEIINAHAEKSAFEFEQVMGTAALMKTVFSGLTPEGILEMVQLTEDMATQFKASEISVEEMGTQIVTAFNRGIERALALRTQGIAAALGFRDGVTYSAKETKEKILAAWKDTEKGFSGASSRMSGTWDGIMSNLKDKWFRFRLMVMEGGLFDAIKSELGRLDTYLSDFLDRHAAEIQVISERIAKLIPDTVALAEKGIGLAAGAEMPDWLIKGKSFVDIGANTITAVFKEAWDRIKFLTESFGEYFGGFVFMLSELWGWFADKMKSMFAPVVNYLIDTLNAVLETYNRISEKIPGIGAIAPISNIATETGPTRGIGDILSNYKESVKATNEIVTMNMQDTAQAIEVIWDNAYENIVKQKTEADAAIADKNARQIKLATVPAAASAGATAAVPSSGAPGKSLMDQLGYGGFETDARMQKAVKEYIQEMRKIRGAMDEGLARQYTLDELATKYGFLGPTMVAEIQANMQNLFDWQDAHILSGLRTDIADTADWTQSTARMVAESVGSMFNSISTFVDDLVDGKLKPLGEYLKSFFASIMKAILNQLAQFAAAKILQFALPDFFAAPSKQHGGFVSGPNAEVPTVLHRGEYVMTQKEVEAGMAKWQGSRGQRPKVNFYVVASADELTRLGARSDPDGVVAELFPAIQSRLAVSNG